MRIFFKLFINLTLVTLIQVTASEVLATVNGYEITQEDVNAFVVQSVPGATYENLNKIQKKTVINQMIERRLALEDAKKNHIEKSEAYQKALQKVEEKLMLDFWMKKQVEEINITKKESKQYYFEHRKKFLQPASVKVRHILLATEEEALIVISELMNSKNLKKDFIKLAKSESTGPSAENGGELDWFVIDEMLPEFSEAAFRLQKGTITKRPVKTQFGYHVIYLEDKRERGVLPYKKVEEGIIKLLRLKKFKIKLENLRKKMKKTAKISVK